MVSGQLDGFSPDSQNLADKCKLIFYFSLDFVDAVFKNEEKELIKLKEKFSSVAAGSEFIEFQSINRSDMLARLSLKPIFIKLPNSSQRKQRGVLKYL